MNSLLVIIMKHSKLLVFFAHGLYVGLDALRTFYVSQVTYLKVKI